MVRKFTCLFIAISISIAAQAKYTPEEYINTFKDLAITEMHRVKIPASITLAQACLESGYGNSWLTVKGKNHFGIKCHKSWEGARLYYDDDAKNECFRHYDDDYQSFIDHSEFLTKRGRYAFLFELDMYDYKAWAKGLKKAGYATDPNYAKRLIYLIEKYNLAQYDQAELPMISTNTEPEEEEHPLHDEVVEFKMNDIRAIKFNSAYTLEEIAKKNEIGVNRLMRYNDITDPSQIQEGMNIFLQPKRRYGNTRYHVVLENETMFMISQMHGIKLNMLYKRNQMVPGTEAETGEKLNLKGKRKVAPKLRTETSLYRKKDKALLEPKYHVVKSRESLTAIGRIYGISMPELKKINNLDSAMDIKKGMVIVVGFEA